MSNDDLQGWVSEELLWDPRVNKSAIAVSADNGEVTLQGTVGSFREKREAQNAAERVYGVKSVRNELKVRILTDYGREDADLRGSVLQALRLDSLIPQTIDARVDDGWVTLTGSAAWQYQRDEAEFIAGNVPGVVGVDDEIGLLVSPEPVTGDVERSIRRALQRTAKLDADSITVGIDDGTVVLTGTVSSWFEHDAAVAAAWAAPGVTNVDDRILVDY
jgi:osmotically-inducible protein OsmY